MTFTKKLGFLLTWAKSLFSLSCLVYRQVIVKQIMLNSIFHATPKKCYTYVISDRKIIKICLKTLKVYILSYTSKNVPIQSLLEAVKAEQFFYSIVSKFRNGAVQCWYHFIRYSNTCILARYTSLTIFSQWNMGQICMQQYFKHIFHLMRILIFCALSNNWLYISICIKPGKLLSRWCKAWYLLRLNNLAFQ